LTGLVKLASSRDAAERDAWYVFGVDDMPGTDVHVNQEGPQNHAHEDVYVAIRDAFDAAVRQLEDHARRLRGEVKSHTP